MSSTMAPWLNCNKYQCQHKNVLKTCIIHRTPKHLIASLASLSSYALWDNQPADIL